MWALFLRSSLPPTHHTVSCTDSFPLARSTNQTRYERTRTSFLSFFLSFFFFSLHPSNFLLSQCRRSDPVALSIPSHLFLFLILILPIAHSLFPNSTRPSSPPSFVRAVVSFLDALSSSFSFCFSVLFSHGRFPPVLVIFHISCNLFSHSSLALVGHHLSHRPIVNNNLFLVIKLVRQDQHSLRRARARAGAGA